MGVNLAVGYNPLTKQCLAGKVGQDSVLTHKTSVEPKCPHSDSLSLPHIYSQKYRSWKQTINSKTEEFLFCLFSSLIFRGCEVFIICFVFSFYFFPFTLLSVYSFYLFVFHFTLIQWISFHTLIESNCYHSNLLKVAHQINIIMFCDAQVSFWSSIPGSHLKQTTE